MPMTITKGLFYYRATIELGDVTPHNLQQLKRLNQVVFPVSYNDKFYKDILEAGELAKLGTTSLGYTFLLIVTHFTIQHTIMILWWELYAAGLIF
jgi:hypothetical protein